MKDIIAKLKQILFQSFPRLGKSNMSLEYKTATKRKNKQKSYIFKFNLYLIDILAILMFIKSFV